MRQNGRIVPVAAIIAVGVNSDGRRKVPGLGIGACGACGGAAVYGTPACSALPFRTGFLRKLTRRGLRGVKPVISVAHEGIKAAVSRVLCATWQRCRVHVMRTALAHAGKGGRRVVSAFIATAFARDDAQAAGTQWRGIADQLCPRIPKLATLME